MFNLAKSIDETVDALEKAGKKRPSGGWKDGIVGGESRHRTWVDEANERAGRKKAKKGEGSRGGKVIGHTKSGKPVYASKTHPSYKSFDKKDHRDAATLHKREARKWKLKYDYEDDDRKRGAHDTKAMHHEQAATRHGIKSGKHPDDAFFEV